MGRKHREISEMNEKKIIAAEPPENYITSQKKAFRRHQRELSFGEKMLISFALADRDATIRSAVLLPKTKKVISKK